MNHTFEERRKSSWGKQHEGSIINVKLIEYTSVNSNMLGARYFVGISVCLKKSRILIMR